jgi:hypothetical protein
LVSGLKIVVSPVRVRVSPLRNPDAITVFLFPERVWRLSIGYRIGYRLPMYFELEAEQPSADRRSGLVRDEVTTISVVIEISADGRARKLARSEGTSHPALHHDHEERAPRGPDASRARE